jgi:hypothetical protein
MSKIVTMTQLNTDSDVIPIKKRELMARLEGDEIKFKQCYEDNVKNAISAKSAKEEAMIYKAHLEKYDAKVKEVVNENQLIKKELEIYKSKIGRPAKELEGRKLSTKSSEDFNKDVEEGYNKTEKEKLEKLKKALEEKFSFK